VDTIKDHPIWIIAAVACAVALAVFSATYQLRIVPLEREITDLKEEINKSAKIVENEHQRKLEVLMTPGLKEPNEANSAEAKSRAAD
jgi:hypothetical protein